MTMTWRRTDALEYAHEDLLESREYRFVAADGRDLVGQEAKTVCGHWFSICEDDPAFRPELWRFKRSDGRPTCPRCVELASYDWPGMLLVVRGALGVPQIVRVTGDEEWVGVFGLAKGRIVNPSGKQVLHVCQEGDVFEDVGVAVRGGELVAI